MIDVLIDVDVGKSIDVSVESTKIETGDYNKLINKPTIHGVELIGDVSFDTVYANGVDYGEVALWEDGNPNNEDRLHRFVTLAGEGRKINIADSKSQIVGVTTTDSAFVGNAKLIDNGVIVGIIGVVNIKTNDSSIEVDDRVMSDDNGYAIKSTNNLGYRVLKVMDNMLEIVVSPNTDMIQRIKTENDELIEQKLDKDEIFEMSNQDILHIWNTIMEV